MSQPAIETNPANPGGQAPPAAAAPAAQPAPAKPWGDDENFDPQKAQRLIENLRQENAGLKTKAQQFDEIERSKMSELEKHQTAAQTEKARADKAEMTAARLRAAMKNGLTEAQAARLSGSTPEEIEADGAAFAQELGITPPSAQDPAAEAETPPDKDITGNTRRPTQQPVVTPRGGTNPAAEPEPDLEKIANEIPR